MTKRSAKLPPGYSVEDDFNCTFNSALLPPAPRVVAGLITAGLFELTFSNGWVLTTLYSFTGCWPVGGVTMDEAGRLFGVCNSGGAHGSGFVFELTNSQGTWSLTDLHDFTGGSDGAPTLKVALCSIAAVISTVQPMLAATRVAFLPAAAPSGRLRRSREFNENMRTPTDG
jgi:hypothetical protein